MTANEKHEDPDAELARIGLTGVRVVTWRVLR